MFRKRSRLFLLLIPVLAVSGVAGWNLQQKGRHRATLTEKLSKTAELLETANFEQAWAELQSIEPKVIQSASPEQVKQINEAFVATLTARNDFVRLRDQFDKAPEVFEKDEAAALLLARLLLEEDNQPKLKALMKEWSQHRKDIAGWFLLDVDVLLKQKRPDEALALLETQSFVGDAESNRLARLALLKAGTNLNEAWSLLEQAFKQNPRNTDIRSFRAQILEAVGQMPAARVEYVAAVVSAPQNPILSLQLGDFYQRQFQYEMALESWKTRLQTPSLGIIWLRSLFWSRVTRSNVVKEYPTQVPDGELMELVVFLQTLPANVFWDDARFNNVPQCDVYRNEREEVAWLRILESLRTQDLAKASEILSKWSGKLRMNPELAVGLHRVVDLKLGNPVSQPLSFAESTSSNAHPFFQLVNLIIKENEIRVKDRELILTEQQTDLQNPVSFLSRNEVFAAACLAGGWCESALKFHDTAVIEATEGPSADLPEWWSFGIAQCLKYNRSAADTIAFIDLQSKSSSTLKTLKAECLLSQNDRPAAIEILKTAAARPDAGGYRAAWMCSTLLLEDQDFVSAEAVVRSQPLLAEKSSGKEILARIRLAAGDATGALAIYETLGQESVEAMAYRARIAFEKKEFAKARTLTNELIRQMPGELQLMANLKAIDAAEKGLEPTL